MKKKVLSVLLATSMVVSLAACGSKEETTDNAAGGSTAASTETADAADTTSADDAIANLIAATEGTVDIQLWCSELESYQTVMKELTDKFQEQYSDVDFNITIGAVSEQEAKDKVLEDIDAAAESIENIASSPAFVNVADQDAITMLTDGTLGAYVSGTWNATSFQDQYGDGYAACKLPTFDVNGTATQMGSYAGYKFVGVNSHAKNVGWSMLLAEYLTNEESQLAIGNATSEGPANTVAAAQIDSPALAALAAQSEFADQQVVGNNYWDPAKALGQNLVDGATDLQAVLDDAVAGITQPVAE